MGVDGDHFTLHDTREIKEESLECLILGMKVSSEKPQNPEGHQIHGVPPNGSPFASKECPTKEVTELTLGIPSFVTGSGNDGARPGQCRVAVDVFIVGSH